MKKLYIISVLASLFLMTGCHSMSNYFGQYEQYLEKQSFNQSVKNSQFLVLEAQALLYEGKEQQAKILLDKAFSQFKDHVLLHETYGNYYQQTNNTILLAVAKKRANDLKVR